MHRGEHGLRTVLGKKGMRGWKTSLDLTGSNILELEAPEDDRTLSRLG